MRTQSARVLVAFLCFVLATCGGGRSADPPPAGSSRNVTTWHYDNMRTGANTNEITLTLANVNPDKFGKLFTLPVDGAVVGQALYLGSVR